VYVAARGSRLLGRIDTARLTFAHPQVRKSDVQSIRPTGTTSPCRTIWHYKSKGICIVYWHHSPLHVTLLPCNIEWPVSHLHIPR
jgi:hypothetical protein